MASGLFFSDLNFTSWQVKLVSFINHPFNFFKNKKKIVLNPSSSSEGGDGSAGLSEFEPTAIDSYREQQPVVLKEKLLKFDYESEIHQEFDYGRGRPGSRLPIVLKTRSVKGLDNDLGWKKLLEGSEEHSVAMQGLITNFQEHFNGMSFEEIEKKLLEIKPGFKQSKRIYQEKVNKALIDSAFELLTTISNDHATNIGVNPNIIEIANMVIEHDKSTGPIIDQVRTDVKLSQIQSNLKSLQDVLDRKKATEVPMTKFISQLTEDEEPSEAPGIKISLVHKAVFIDGDDLPSKLVAISQLEMLQKLSGPPIKSQQELSKEHLKQLFEELQSKSSEFKPYYGGSKGKDMFLNVAVEKIQSALRSPENRDRVKGVLGSLHSCYGGRAVKELEGLSETNKALISKPSQNELSVADKDKIKEQLKYSFELYEKLENAGVYLLRDKSAYKPTFKKSLVKLMGSSSPREMRGSGR